MFRSSLLSLVRSSLPSLSSDGAAMATRAPGRAAVIWQQRRASDARQGKGGRDPTGEQQRAGHPPEIHAHRCPPGYARLIEVMYRTGASVYSPNSADACPSTRRTQQQCRARHICILCIHDAMDRVSNCGAERKHFDNGGVLATRLGPSRWGAGLPAWESMLHVKHDASTPRESPSPIRYPPAGSTGHPAPDEADDERRKALWQMWR